jgi:hypothetical protein
MLMWLEIPGSQEYVTPLGSSTSQNFHASRKSIFQRISLVHRPFGPRRLVFQRIG